MQQRMPNGTLKAMARGQLLGKYSVFTAVVLLTSIIRAAANSVVLTFVSPYSVFGIITYYLILFILNVLFTVLEAGGSYLALSLCRNEACSVSQIFYFFRNQSDTSAKLGLILTAISCAGAVPYLAFTFLPGNPDTLVRDLLFLLGALAVFLLVYVAVQLHFMFAFYILADNPSLSTGEILRESLSLMRGSRLRLLGLMVSFAGWYLLGALSFGLAMLWIIPYQKTVFAYFYLHVKGEPAGSNIAEI